MIHLTPCPLSLGRKGKRHAVRSCFPSFLEKRLGVTFLAAVLLALILVARAFAVPMSWGGGGGEGCSGVATLSNGITTVSSQCITGSLAITLNANGDPNVVYTDALASGSFTILSQSALDDSVVYWTQL